MKILFVLTLLILIQFNYSKVCRAIALGGGGDRGVNIFLIKAYQIGVLKALVNYQRPEFYSWQGNMI